MTGRQSAGLGVIVATSAAACVSMFTAWTVPLQVAELTQTYGWSGAHAGAAATAGLLVTSGAMVVIAPYLPKIRCERLALWGATLATLGFALLLFAKNDPWLVVVGLVICGVGQGAAGAGRNAMAASATDPGRVFSAASISGIVFGASWLVLLPIFRLPQPGVDAIFAGCTLAMLLCLLLITLSGFKTERPVGLTADGGKLKFTRTMAAPLASGFLLCAAGQSIWAFADVLGLRSGWQTPVVGLFLSIAAAASIAGPIGVALLSRRRNLGVALGCAFAATGAAYFLSCVPLYAPVFLASLLVQSVGQIAVNGLIYVLGVRADPTGRLSTLAASFAMFGVSAGPAIGGLLINSGAVAFGSACLIASAIAWLAMAWFERSVRLGAAGA